MRLISPITTARVVLLASLAVVAACDNDPTEPTTPSQITVVTGSTVTGNAGGTKTVTVTVTNQNGKPLPTQPVTFTAGANSGTVNPTTATTDASGSASAIWTFGNSVGVQTLTVTAGTVTQAIAATVAAGAPASIVATAGANQSATAGAAVATAPAVTVRDAGGNPVSGVQVTFASTPGGTVNPASVSTDANGVARVTSWTLGNAVGVYTLTATALASGITGNPIAITATATAGAAARIQPGAGLPTSATVGSALSGTGLPSVTVVDANSNPVAGVAVTFTVASGGGTLTGSTVTTNAQGVATVGGFTLGQTAGANVITASAQGAGAVNLTINGTAGAAATTTILSGNNQAVGAGQALPSGPSVRVVDRFGNPVAGVTVQFSVASGGGSLLGGTQTTNAQGVATVGGWTLGITPGANTLVARVAGAADVTFTATGLAGPPAQLLKVSGDSITVVAFRTATTPFVVRVLDAAGFPVQGATVTFAVTTANTGSLSTTTATTDASGNASTSFVANGVLGINTVTATVGSLPAVSFTVTTTSNAVASITPLAPLTQSATAGAQVGSVPAVRLLDDRGNPVPGVRVFFVASSGSSVQNPSALSDQTGVASAGAWTLSGAPGTNTVAALSNVPGNVPNSTVIFTAQGISIPAGATLTVLSTIPATAPAGSAIPISVQVKDVNGAALVGVSVSFEVTTGGGSIGGGATVTTVTNASGVATAPNWVLGTGTGVTNSLIVNVINGPSQPISIVTQ